MDINEILADPRVPAAAAGAVVVVVAVVAMVRRSRRKRATVDLAARAAREKRRILVALRAFRDDLRRAVDGSDPVFRRIEKETDFASVIGHWRTVLKHRITVRGPDLGELKTAVRGLGMDSSPLSDLEVAWRKLDRQVADYNAGKIDASPTPIATVRTFEKDMEKVMVLANICLKAFEG